MADNLYLLPLKPGAALTNLIISTDGESSADWAVACNKGEAGRLFPCLPRKGRAISEQKNHHLCTQAPL